jgi:hypothetical protein
MLGIIGGVKKPGSDAAVQGFEVRQIDIHSIFQQGQRRGRLITRGIPQYRYCQALAPGFFHTDDNGRGCVAPGYNIDILRAPPPEGQAYFRKLRIRNGSAKRPGVFLPRNLMILTKNAAQVTAAYKDGPRASGSGNRRFLPPVNGSGSHPQSGGLPAKAIGAGLSIHTAGSGTKKTFFVISA